MDTNTYVITYINERGDLQRIERNETEEELHDRIKSYRQHNYKIISVFKKIITANYVKISY